MRLFDFGPLIEQNLQVAHKIARALSFSDGADDDAYAIRNIQLAQNLAQPLAFLRILDLAGNAAPIAERHQHQIAAGKTEIGCDARPFGADRAFGHLHDYIRTNWVNVRNILSGDPSCACAYSPGRSISSIPLSSAAGMASQKWRNAFFSKPMSTNIAFKPISMFLTRPL